MNYRKSLMTKSFSSLLLSVLILFFVTASIEAVCIPTRIVIEEIRPQIPGLTISRWKGCTEALQFTNDTSEEVVILRGTQEIVHIHPHKQGVAEYYDYTGWQDSDKSYYLLTPASSSGQDLGGRTLTGSWKIRGRVGNQDFEVRGKTVRKAGPVEIGSMDARIVIKTILVLSAGGTALAFILNHYLQSRRSVDPPPPPEPNQA